MIFNPDVHQCGICGHLTQTLNGRACVSCQEHIKKQSARYLCLAGYMSLEVDLLFGTYDKTLEAHREN